MIRFESFPKKPTWVVSSLKNVSFNIGKGEMIFCCRTLRRRQIHHFALIAGIRKPTSGKVLINKHDLGSLTDNQLCYLRQHIGIVFQDHKNFVRPQRVTKRHVAFENHWLRQPVRRKTGACCDWKSGAQRTQERWPKWFIGRRTATLVYCACRSASTQLVDCRPDGNTVLDRAYALDIMELFKTFHEAGTTVIVMAARWKVWCKITDTAFCVYRKAGSQHEQPIISLAPHKERSAKRAAQYIIKQPIAMLMILAMLSIAIFATDFVFGRTKQ